MAQEVRGNLSYDDLALDARLGPNNGTVIQYGNGTFTDGNLPKYMNDGTTEDSGVKASSAQGLFVMIHYLEGAPKASEKVWAMSVPANITTAVFAANFAGSAGHCGTNPTATAVYTLNKNGSSIGTCTISTSGTFTFATGGGAAQSLAAGDLLQVIAPSSVDATLADVNISWYGTR